MKLIDWRHIYALSVSFFFGKELVDVAEKILSVGIDIGTSTTSLVFSHLTIEKTTGDMYMPKTEITDKCVIYRSPVYLTPLKSNTELDAEGIRAIIESEYQSAGIKVSDVETGAVIITGDTARKKNAETVLTAISKFAGDFVVAVAGPELESILAGKGSGAKQYSADTIETICNLDIGGGTTNTAAFYDSTCIDTDCMDIGGRLIRFRPGTTTIEYIFPKISVLAGRLGITAETGADLTAPEIRKITDAMAKGVMGKLERPIQSEEYRFLCTEEGKIRTLPRKVDSISFSGGVGKLIYEEVLPEKLAYDDIGVYLAESLKKSVQASPFYLVKPKETISATVIGAGNHSVDVSGGTITVSDFQKLPLKNIPVISIQNPLELSQEEFEAEIGKKSAWFRRPDEKQSMAIVLEIQKKMGFTDITQLAEKIVQAAENLMAHQDTIIVAIYGDYAKVLGQSILVRLPKGKDIICIDSVDAGKGDYIDIGRPVGVADSVPVVIKTIAFNY